MSDEHETDGPSHPESRAQRIRQIADEYLQRWVAGESVSIESVIAAHQELLPELSDELRRVRLIVLAQDVCLDDAPQTSGNRPLRSRQSKNQSETDPTDTAASHDDQDTNSTPRLTPDQLEADGYIIGRYRVVKTLGGGAFGAVYLAEDTQLARRVALKLLKGEYWDTAQAAKALDREAKLAAQLNHPGIVTIYDVGRTSDGEPFLVMEYVMGGTLRDALRLGPLPAERAASFLADLADAVHHAHKHGLVHRDLKPENVLLETAGRPRIADFGLALHEMAQRHHKGEVAGTGLYMAPEQVRGEAHQMDGRADIWSLGVVLYELLTGRPPFKGTRFSEVSEEILNREPKPPRQIDDTIPASLEAICLKCLSKNVNGRYTTAADLAHELRRVVEGKTARKRLTNAWVWAAGLACLCVTGWFAYTHLVLVPSFKPSSPPEKETKSGQTQAPDRARSSLGGLTLIIPDDPAVDVILDGKRVVIGQDGYSEKLPSGEHSLAVTRHGYEYHSETVFIAPGGSNVLTIPALGDDGPFDLTRAVEESRDGGEVLIRGDGPFVTDPVRIVGKDLTIRAASGFLPQIVLASNANAPLLTTDSSLTLAGLELRARWDNKKGQGLGILVDTLPSTNWRSHNISNCRFVLQCEPTRPPVPNGCIRAGGFMDCTVTDCLFYSAPGGTSIRWIPTGYDSKPDRLIVDNCIFAGQGVIAFDTKQAAERLRLNESMGKTIVEMTRCTCCTRVTIQSLLVPRVIATRHTVFEMRVSQSIFEAREVLLMHAHLTPRTITTRDLMKIVSWNHKGPNLFPASPRRGFVFSRSTSPMGAPTEIASDFAEWMDVSKGQTDDCWGASQIEFTGSDAGTSRSDCTATDFQLTKAILLDGRELTEKELAQLGATPESVGPGRAYSSSLRARNAGREKPDRP